MRTQALNAEEQRLQLKQYIGDIWYATSRTDITWMQFVKQSCG